MAKQKPADDRAYDDMAIESTGSKPRDEEAKKKAQERVNVPEPIDEE